MYITRIFWKENGPGLLFGAVQATETKFRRSTGVTTANSTNKNPNVNKLSWAINYSPPLPTCTSPISSSFFSTVAIVAAVLIVDGKDRNGFTYFSASWQLTDNLERGGRRQTRELQLLHHLSLATLTPGGTSLKILLAQGLSSCPKTSFFYSQDNLFLRNKHFTSGARKV